MIELVLVQPMPRRGILVSFGLVQLLILGQLNLEAYVVLTPLKGVFILELVVNVLFLFLTKWCYIRILSH